MVGVGGCHDNRVNVRVVDEFFAVREKFAAVLFGDALASIGECVGDRHDLRALQRVVDSLNVRPTDCTRADQSEFQICHDNFSFRFTKKFFYRG